MVPPSMMYSDPVMVAARGDARNTIKFAISSGLDGRPIGIPPRLHDDPLAALVIRARLLSQPLRHVNSGIGLDPSGRYTDHSNAFGRDFLRQALAIGRQSS